MDILKADQEMSSLKQALEDMQISIDDQHHRLDVEAGLEPNQPRTIQHQIHRSNLSSSSVEEYYWANLTVVFLDHSLQQVQSRFPLKLTSAIRGSL